MPGWLSTDGWKYPASVPLPDAPDHPAWGQVWESIEEGDLDESMADFRFWCHQSFWFFNKYCLSFGELLCREPDNPHRGRPWVDHPWIFDRCMELQRDPDDQWHCWPRGYFKSALITQNFTIWEWIRDCEPGVIGTSLRTLILTYKAETTGAAFMFMLKRELQENAKLTLHWPELFYENPKDSGDFGSRTFRIRQRGNPKEPTVTVSGLDTQPTSQHYDRIVFDDPVVRETVRTAEMIESTVEAMKQATFLRADDTQVRYIGTHWTVDDPWTRARKEGRFRVNHHDCYDGNGEPVLRSRTFLEKYLRDSGPYEFAAQMRNKPIAAGEQKFQLGWIKRYDNDPLAERSNKNVYMFIDTARVQKKGSDYTVIWVIGLGADTYLYALDCHLGRYSLPEFYELLFDQVAIWKPLIVFQEVFGGARDIEGILEHQRRVQFRFQIEPMPDEKLPKEERITSLMKPFSQGRWYFPKAGFGRTPRNDHRDVMRVFLEDEYELWTPTGRTVHDDMLDCLAFTARPKVVEKMRWPQRLPTSPHVRKNLDFYENRRYDDGESGAGPTAWSN